jgi:hypothetical protein
MAISEGQKVRQRTRDNGRYAAVSKCMVCGKGVADYYSSAHGRVLVVCHKAKCMTVAEERERVILEAEGGCDPTCGYCRSNGWKLRAA